MCRSIRSCSEKTPRACTAAWSFSRCRKSVYTALCANPKMKKWKDKAGLENIALSTRIMSKQGCTNICKQAFEYAKKTGRKRVTLIEKPNVLRETGGLMMRCFQDVAKELSRHSRGRREHRRHLHVDVQESAGLLGARRGKHVRRHRQRFVRRSCRRTRLRAQRQSRRQLRRLRTDARLCAEIRRPIQGQSNRHALDLKADARLAQGNRHGHAFGIRHRARDQGRQSAHVRHGRQRFHARRGQSHRRLRGFCNQRTRQTENPLLHICDLYDTALCLRVLWILHHRHVQFLLAFAEGDVCCAITRGDLKYV